jgi:hypothetical protein
MDPGLLLSWHLRSAPVASEHSVVRPGVFAPVVWPMAWAPPQERLAMLQQQPGVPLHRLVEAALELGDDAVLDALLARRLGSAALPAELMTLLQPRMRQRLQQLGVEGEPAWLAWGADGRRTSQAPTAVFAAWDELRVLLGVGEQRLWLGPILLRYGAEAPPLARRIVPELSLASDTDTPANRRAAGRALAELYLGLAAPPPDGWPVWLTRGVTALAAERAVGAVPSLSAAAARRAALGVNGLESLLAATDPVEADALALAVELLHSRHRAHFPQLLEALRGGLAGPQAIAIAYGRDLASLTTP